MTATGADGAARRAFWTGYIYTFHLRVTNIRFHSHWLGLVVLFVYSPPVFKYSHGNVRCTGGESLSEHIVVNKRSQTSDGALPLWVFTVFGLRCR